MARKHALNARLFALQDDFNMLFRELAFEMKGKATDRLKTPEEIAKEEKERLEQLEVPATTPRACRL
jgi:nucleolar protein 14